MNLLLCLLTSLLSHFPRLLIILTKNIFTDGN
jgi:hypothetical protein